MAYDRFLIAPFSDGLRTDLQPWMIPDESFAELNNAYVWRGRVRKRFGGELMGSGSSGPLTAPLLSRFRIPITAPLTLGGGGGVGITDGAGNATNPALPIPWPQYKIGQVFIINGMQYNVSALGLPAALTPVAPAIGAGTFNTTTGIYNFVGVSPNSPIYFYPNGNSATNAVGVATGVIDGAPYTIGTQFSIGDVIFTVYDAAAGANQMLRTDGSIEAATFDLATGIFNITIAALPATQIYFYPALPVMGLCTYALGNINNHPSIGFDTKFAYEFTNGWNRMGEAQNLIFHGDDSHFFWTCNWTGIVDNQLALFVSNFNATLSGVPAATDDPMWYYVQFPTAPNVQWTTFAPQVTVAGGSVLNQYIVSARIILPFKDRLVLLNTVEQTRVAGPVLTNYHYKNRCRYSFNGSPLAVNAFIQQKNAGFEGAGYIDAPTDEAIISAEYIKDRLIVYFERSTWELAYTNNQVLPFLWQQINTELGAESTYATVPFDKAVLGIGNTGVHACSGANVERIDTKIPDQIFQIANKNEGVQRVVGIRDYYVEMVYWTFPNSTENALAKFPNQVLVYNYKTNSWAFNDDCITMFGYYEQQIDTTWASSTIAWANNNSTWASGVEQSNFRQVIAGNQQGYTFIVMPDTPYNAPVMTITNMTVFGLVLQLTVINHTLATGDWIYITNCQGVVGLNSDETIHSTNYQVLYIDDDTIQIPIPAAGITGVYTGGGSITRVSEINIITKQFNPYVDKGRNVYIAKIDFGVLATAFGEITVDYSVSSSPDSMVQNATASGAILGTSVLETSPYFAVPQEGQLNETRLWHPVYFQVDGECIQFRLYLSDEEMSDPYIAQAAFWLEGMVLHCMQTAWRLE